MSQKYTLDDTQLNKPSNEFSRLTPHLRKTLRQIHQMKLQGERFTSIYFSNEEVVLELEQKLWGRVLLVFSENSQIDIGCVNMPTKWLKAEWWISEDATADNPCLSFQIQFDSGLVTLSSCHIEIRKQLASKGYLQNLENRIATDAIMGEYPFDYGLFFRLSAHNVREKKRFCGVRHLRKVERDLLLLENFLIAQMNDVFRGRLCLLVQKNVSKQQRLNPLHWNKLLKLIEEIGPHELCQLVHSANAIMMTVQWYSNDWTDQFSQLNERFESIYGEFGMHTASIYQEFCFYLLGKMNKI